MGLFLKVENPFKNLSEAVGHLIARISDYAANEGNCVTDGEKQLLAGRGALPDEFRDWARELIGQLLRLEPEDELEADSTSFGNSVLWARRLADKSALPNVLTLAHEVQYEFAHQRRELHGWKRRVDAISLWLTGLFVVFLMFAVVIALGFIFHWK